MELSGETIPCRLLKKYSQWANDYQENQITIIYDTMWNGTKILAEKIAEGIGLADQEVVVKVFNLSKSDENDIITEVFQIKNRPSRLTNHFQQYFT